MSPASSTLPLSPAAPPAAGRRATHARTRLALRLAGAAVSGLTLVAAFPPFAHWWCAPLGAAGVIGVTHGVRARVGALLGLVAGLAFFLPLFTWLRPVGTDAWLLLSVVQALFFAALGAALAAVSTLRAWPAWIPAVWVAWDALRTRWPFGGFSWGRLGFAQDHGPLTSVAAVGGVPLLTAVVALIGSAVVWLALSGALGRQRGLAGAGLTLVGALALPALIPVPVTGETAAGPATAVLAIVQGNVPGRGMDAFDRASVVLRNHVRVTEELAAEVAAGRHPQPQAVLWSENAADVSPVTDAEARRLVDQAGAAIKAPLLVGTVVTENGRRTNAGVVWESGRGETGRYTKRHLVPFGEYIPFRGVVAKVVSRFDRVPVDFQPGSSNGRLDIGSLRVADVICLEVAYDGLVASGVRNGGRLITVQSNNATYGEVQSSQQLAMARLRAVEHGRTVLVAATNGISAVIAPDGRLVAQSRMYESAALVETVSLRDSLTVADRLGGWPEGLIALIGSGALAAVMVGAMRRRHRVRRAPGA